MHTFIKNIYFQYEILIKIQLVNKEGFHTCGNTKANY